jgi:serine/threonine protein kinase
MVSQADRRGTRSLVGERNVNAYRRIRQIGEGTYGKVYLCEDKQGGAHVAVKRVQITTGKEGFPQTAVREIKLLAQLRHDNIIRLKEIVTSPPDPIQREQAGSARDCDTIFLVFEYMVRHFAAPSFRLTLWAAKERLCSNGDGVDKPLCRYIQLKQTAQYRITTWQGCCAIVNVSS